MNEIFEFGISTRILLGPGAIQQTNSLLKTLNAHKILVITDPAIDKIGVTERVTEVFRDEFQFTVFKDVEANPSIETVEKATTFCREQLCDVLLAIGGGSAIDTSKSVALLMTNPGPLTNYGGINQFSKQPLPSIAIPTTAGSGSEVSQGVVLKNNIQNFKFVIKGQGLAPRYAILDPNMLASLPSAIAATTGIDALTHAIEAFVSRNANIFSDALALQAIKLIGQNIRLFAFNPSNIQQAMSMQVGSILSNVAVDHARAGAVHAMAHPLGGHYDLPHGLACAILLPYIMEYNCSANLDKFSLIAWVLGENTSVLTLRESALRSVQVIKDLLYDLGIPTTLRNTSAKEEGISIMAEDALKTGGTVFNPRQTTLDDIVELYRRAFNGDLR